MHQFVLILSFFALQMIAEVANAQITITSVSGASNFVAATSGTTTPIIYGGISGDVNDCDTQDEDELCNNCTATMIACNPNRIHPNLKLRINFTVTGDITGTIKFTHSSTLTDIGTFTPSTTGTLSKGSTGYVETTWDVLCNAIEGDSCITPFTGGVIQVGVSTATPPASGSYSTISLKVVAPEDATNGVDTIECGLSPEQDGICAFVAYPGDRKIYVEDLDDEGSYPSADNVPFQFLRIIFSETGFNDITYATAVTDGRYADLTIDTDGGVSPDNIDGIENDIQYYFKSVMVDAAGNLAYMTSDTEIEKTCVDVTAPTLAACEFAAVPSEVFGLLAEDFNCFISTAAYGTLMAPKVQDFRAFRNKFLVPYDLGRKFIFYYYDIGPKAARWMWEHPWSKPVVRAALWPVWLYAVIANSAGIFIANITFVLIFALVSYSIYVLRLRATAVKVRRRDK